MATTEVDTAETVPLTPLQKIEIDDKELLTPESANQLSKDELKNIEIEITKALETAEQFGDGDTETTPVYNDAMVSKSHDVVGAKENVGTSESRVLEKVPSDPEVTEESNSTESHVHIVTDEKDELSVNGKLVEQQESGCLVKEVEELQEKETQVPYVENVDKGEAEEPAESQSGAAVQTLSENLQFSDHNLNPETYKEGETQQGADKSSSDTVKAISSVTVEQTEKKADIDDAKEMRESLLDLQVRDKDIPENQAEVSKEPESIPNTLYEESQKVAERSEEEKQVESISDDPSTSQKDNDNLEREKSVEVIADDSENKELIRAIDTLHEEDVDKAVPERLTQPEESLHIQAEESKTKDKEIDSTQVEEHLVKNTTKVEEDPEQVILLNNGPQAEKLENSSNIIPAKTEDEEPSESAVNSIPDVKEENTINEQHSKEADTEFKNHITSKETDTTQLALEETENKDAENPTKESSSLHIEETQSAESEKIEDDQISVPKAEDPRDDVSHTDIIQEKIIGSHDVEVDTGSLQPVLLEKSQETDTDDSVKHSATEKTDTVQVTQEPQKVEGIDSKVESNEVDISQVSNFSNKEQGNEEKSKEEPSPTSQVELLLQGEENKSEIRDEIIEEVNDGHISTSIEDSITEQTNTVGHDKNILTVSHEDGIGVSLDDKNEDSNKNEISEQLITETEEETEKNASQNDKPDFEVPESSSITSTEKPEEEDVSDDIESAREMIFAAVEKNKNTGGEETEILDHNADVKEILSTEQIPAETKDEVSDYAGVSILPEEEKDHISVASKAIDSAIEDNIEEKEETSEPGSEKIVEPEKPHDIDSLQIGNNEDAETKEAEKIEVSEKEVANITSLTITEDDYRPGLSLHEESNQYETSKDEEAEEKNDASVTVEIVPVATSVETKEDESEKDKNTPTSLNVQEPIEKVEHDANTNKENPTSECDIQGISEELSVENRWDTTVDASNAVEALTDNVEGNNSENIVEESIKEDPTKPDEVIVPLTGVQTHGIEEVSKHTEQVEETASVENIENKVETSQEVVSERDSVNLIYQEREIEPVLDDSEKLKQSSEPDPDDTENLEKVSTGNKYDKENLKQISVSEDSEQLEQVSEPDTDDNENLEQVCVSGVLENLPQVSEQDLDDTDNLKQVSELRPDDQIAQKQVSGPDQDDSEHLKEDTELAPDESENLKKIFEPDLDDSEIGQASEPDPDELEKVKKDPELDTDDMETQELLPLKNAYEPGPTDSEHQETVDKVDSINEHPTVKVLEKTYEQPEQDTVSDNVSSVSEVEQTATPHSIEVLNITDIAPETSFENSLHENSSKYQIPELKAEEEYESSQTTHAPTIESATEHVEEPSSEETVGAIQHNDPEEEKKTSEVPDEHANIKEVEGAEGLSLPGVIFVEDRKPDEAEEEIKKGERITNVAAATVAHESEKSVTEVESDQTHVHEVKDPTGVDEIQEDEANKEVIVQEREPALIPKETEELRPSALSLNDEGIADLEAKYTPEESLQKDKDGQEEAGNITDNIAVSEVLVQPRDNPGEEAEHFPGEAELRTSIVNDEKISSLTSEEEKEEQQDDIKPEVVIKDREENNQPKIDDNVEEKGTAPEMVVLKDAQTQPDELLNEPEGYENLPSMSNDEDTKIPKGQKNPEEVEEKISVEKQPESDDTVTDIETAEDAVLQQGEEKEERDEIRHLTNETEETIHDKHISYQIPELRAEEKPEPNETIQEPVTETETEHPEEKVSVTHHNDTNEDNQTSEASEKHTIKDEEGPEGQSTSADALVDDKKPDEADKDIQKEDSIEKVAVNRNEVEPETPVSLVQGNQNMVDEVNEEHGEREILKGEDVKKAILQEIEPEVVPVHLPEPSASSSNDDGITHLVSKDLPEEVLQEENEKDVIGGVENVTEKISLSKEREHPHDNSGEETENRPIKTEEVEPEIVTEDGQEKDQQKTDDIVNKNQTTEEVIVPVVEQVQLDQLINEPESNEPSATCLNDEDAIEREKGPEEVQEVRSVGKQTEDNDSITKNKIAEEAVSQKDEQREELIHLPNQAEDTEIPSDNFTALKDEEEKENLPEAKENDTIHETGSASEVLINEDQQSEQLKHLLSEEEEEAKPSTIDEEVVQENKTVKCEYLPSESVEAEPIGEDETATVFKTEPIGEDETATVFKTEEEPEGILHEKKTDQVKVETEDKENVDDELKLKSEADQGQLELESYGTENLETRVSYTNKVKQISLESEKILEEDLEEKSKSDHFKVDYQEKETVKKELLLQEPPASHGNDDDITTQKSEENTEDLQERKETKKAEDDGELSEYINEAHAPTLAKENNLANMAVEADSSVENALAGKAVPRGEEDPELVEEKDQVIQENVFETDNSVEEDRKGDKLEHFPILSKDTEAYALSVINRGEQTDAEETKKDGQETRDDTRQKDPSNEDVESSLEELNAGSIETKNNLESKEHVSVEDNAKENSTIEKNSSLGKLENKMETSYLETQNIKSADEKVPDVEETVVINKLHESIVEKDVDEVVTVSVALPTADDKFDDALESLPSVEVPDSEVQRDIVESTKETEEENFESIIPIAGKDDEEDVIHMETNQEKLKVSEGNELPILGEEDQNANEFVTTITTPAVEDDQVNAPESTRKHEEETFGDKEQWKLISSETFNCETNETITENQIYNEAETSAGRTTEEPGEISSLVLDKVDEIQKKHEGDENSPTIQEKADLALENVTPETLEALVTEKVPDESAKESEGTTKQITKEEIISKEISVNEGQNLKPLSSESPDPEELCVREVVELKEVLQMQEASLVTNQLKDKLNKQKDEAKYIKLTQKGESEDEKNAARHDSSSEIMTEPVKLQELKAIIAPLEDETIAEVDSTELIKEETKGETDSVKEDVNIEQFQAETTSTTADEKTESSQETAEETKVSKVSQEVSTREFYAGEAEQINEAQERELLENKVEPKKESEAVLVEREVPHEEIQDLKTIETKGYKLDDDLDESSTNDAAIKVKHADGELTTAQQIPMFAQVELSEIPLKTHITNILERQEGEDATEKSKPAEAQSTKDVKEEATGKDHVAISEKDDTKPSSEIEIPRTSREFELVAPQSIVNTVLTKGSDTTLDTQQLIKSNSEAPSIENTCAEKNLKDSPTPFSTESKNVPTEIQQSTARSLDFAEVIQPESAKKTESQIPLNIQEENSLSELLQISTKDTIQMTQQSNQETNPKPNKEDIQTEDPKTDEDKEGEEDEEGEEHKKTDSSSDGVIVEASRDMDVKSPQKKHHGILSGVGTKVKHGISKVKKAITGKSSHSHPKPQSPK